MTNEDKMRKVTRTKAGGSINIRECISSSKALMALRLKYNLSGIVFFFSSRRRHTRYIGDWSSDVCSSDLGKQTAVMEPEGGCGRGPRTGEPFTAERVAMLDEGRDAAEGELQIRHVKAQRRSEERRVGKECKTRRTT